MMAAKKGQEVVVSALPECDLCRDGTVARYDGATSMGPWAYMCTTHFELCGMGLGTGRGQRLILISDDENLGIE